MSDGSLPELRTDWLTGRSVLVAANRAKRPNEFGGSFGDESLSVAANATIFTAAMSCPFCAGQEHCTPPSLYELTDERGQWQTRVVPNMYPAVAAAPEQGGGAAVVGVTKCDSPGQTIAAGLGVHEVIIESPRHLDRMAALSQGELRGVLETFAQRLHHWGSDGRFGYGLVFKNQGARAGASLSHVHSQFIALPAAPPAVAAECDRAASGFLTQGVCPYCRLIEHERADGARIVHQTDDFVAFCPFASLQPFEVWLLPMEHAAYFEDSAPDKLDRLAMVLGDVLRRVETIVPEAAYNMLLRTSPWRGGHGDASHWRIEILPRTNAFAGFELASGMLINPIAPERAAGKLLSI